MAFLKLLMKFWPPKTPKCPLPLGVSRGLAPWGIEGLIVFSLCPFPVEYADVYKMLCQLVHPFGSYSRFLNFWPPKTPQNAPWGIEGLIVFSLCPFPDESAGVYQIVCQLVHLFGSYSRFLNFWPPKTPQNAPWGIEGLIVFSLCPFPDESAGVYHILCQLVHLFGSYSRFLNFWPPKTPQNAPWGIEGLIVFSLCPFPDESAGVYQIVCQLVHLFGSYSRFLNFWPPKNPQNAPWGIEGLIVFSLCPFPDESAGVYQIVCQLVHLFGSYSRFLNFWPPKTPQNAPWGIEGLIVLAYVHSQMNQQACTKFGISPVW